MNKQRTKILVTGGAGFLGSAVVKELLNRGYKVKVVDDLSKRYIQIPDNCEFLKADLTEKKAAIKAMHGMDYCIHMAAKIGGIGYFHKYPALILSENNKMYSNIFEAASMNRIKRIVYISSSMVFESAKSFPSRESDIINIPPPVSSYGFSKLIGEWYCKSFKEEFGLNYSIVRPFNAYGINEFPGEEIGYAHVIPDLIKKVLSGQYPLELLGSGKQTRCFTHVEDIARGIIMVMESELGENEDFNIGSEKEISILNLARIIWKECKITKPFRVKFIEGYKYDIRRRVPSVRKTKKILNWKPEKKLEQELPVIIDWMKNMLYHEER